MRMIAALATTSLAIMGALPFGKADSAELHVLSTRATEELYRELVPGFEKATGHRVVTTFAGTSDVEKKTAAGEAYDVVIAIDTLIDDFIKAGKVVPGSRVDIAKSGVGIGLHAGLPKPDISSTAALKQALLAARSIGFSTGPSGAVVSEMLAKMGIAETVKAKIKQPPSGVLVGTFIASGEAEIGFQQTNELSHFPGVDYLGPMPAEFQDVTARSGGITMVSREREAANALLRFLTASEAAPVIRKFGLDPL
jgi:molybdate transport system substrate-binding protein